jgi:hypothetical protein
MGSQPARRRGGDGGGGDPAGLHQAVREEMEVGTGKGWKGTAPMRLSTIYRGGVGWFLSLQAPRALAKGEEGNPSFPFLTDRYPPFLGILILSLRDMILFLVRGILVHLEQGCGAFPPLPTFMWVPHASGPHSGTF